MKILTVVLLGVACMEVKAQPPDHIDSFDEDLMLMTATIKHFQVREVPVADALDTVCTLVLGTPKRVNVFIKPESASKTLPKITLDLHDVPAEQAIDYIAQLSGSKWKIGGRADSGYHVELDVLTEIDDSELFEETHCIHCSAKAAHALGFRDDMTQKEASIVLAGYGIGPRPDYAALWRLRDEKLIFRVKKTDVSLVESLIRLAEGGFQITPPSAKPFLKQR